MHKMQQENFYQLQASNKIPYLDRRMCLAYHTPHLSTLLMTFASLWMKQFFEVTFENSIFLGK